MMLIHNANLFHFTFHLLQGIHIISQIYQTRQKNIQYPIPIIITANLNSKLFLMRMQNALNKTHQTENFIVSDDFLWR